MCCLKKDRDKLRRDKIARNTELEMELHAKMKREFEQYADTITENGTNSIEEEMSATSDLVYVVTSIHRDRDPFTPKCHGIFTTCSKAQAAAKKVFEAVSASYRGGFFLKNDERISKCDITEFLKPGVEFTGRLLFEKFEDNCAVVAINAIYIDMDVEEDLPFLYPSSQVDIGQGKKSESDVQAFVGDQVYAIFEFGPQTHVPGSYGNIRLCGVYQEKRKAITRGKDFTDFESLIEDCEEDEDHYSLHERKKEIDCQLKGANSVTNGLLFDGGEDGEDPWAVAMETVVLDQLNVNVAQIDFGHMKFHDSEDVAFFSRW